MIFFGTLKEIKVSIKTWHANKGDNLDSEIKSLESKLQVLDKEGGDAMLTSQVFEQLQHACHKEQIQLSQKSRLNWDIEGDCNSRFFHKVIQHRRSRNRIHRIFWKGEMIVNPIDIKKCVFQGFKDFFCNSAGLSPFNLSSLKWKKIPAEEAKFLIRQFSREEIWVAL